VGHRLTFDPHFSELGQLDLIHANKTGLHEGVVPFRPGCLLVTGHDFIPGFPVGLCIFLERRSHCRYPLFSMTKKEGHQDLFLDQGMAYLPKTKMSSQAG
jgi:hypothetical protein